MSQKDDYLENYQDFIDEILETGEVWGLMQDEGWAMCESEGSDDQSVIPFWSSAELAKEHCGDEWQGYTVEQIGIIEFVEAWLPGMKEDNLLLGPNWNSHLEGLEIEPSELISMFK